MRDFAATRSNSITLRKTAGARLRSARSTSPYSGDGKAANVHFVSQVLFLC